MIKKRQMWRLTYKPYQTSELEIQFVVAHSINMACRSLTEYLEGSGERDYSSLKIVEATSFGSALIDSE